MATTNASFNHPNTTLAAPGQAGQDDNGDGQVLEAYTVVLSLTCHLVSLLFGGTTSLAVLMALAIRRNLSKYSYLHVLTFLTGCFCLNFIYSPMEIVDLLAYHSQSLHPARDFVAAKTALYVFFLSIINIVIAFLATESLLRATNHFGGLLQKIWPTISTISTVFLSLIFTGAFLEPATEPSGQRDGDYAPMQHGFRTTFQALIVLLFTIAAVVLLVLVISLVKVNVYWEDGRPRIKKKQLRLAIPEFLISQSNNACEEVESGFENDQEPSQTPSPSTPKLLTVCEQVKGEDVMPIPDLPKNKASAASGVGQSSGKLLGINMSQVLGRRRHTICQISDSSAPSPAPADPIAKAKQYNYVRKFSVDISALQAQLQNPKIFKEAPFQSDMDLTRRPTADGANVKPNMPAPKPKPLLPLKPLDTKRQDSDNDVKRLSNAVTSNSGDKTGDSPMGATSPIPISPPPVIMVSNDDALPDNEDGDEEAGGEISTLPSVTVNSDGLNGKTSDVYTTQPAITIQKPASLSLKDNNCCSKDDEVTSAPTLESAITDASEGDSEGRKLARLALLLALTFLLTVLPVVIVESLHRSLKEKSFVNISTCTIAVSTIQVIIYPNLFICIDDVIHKSVQKLKTHALRLFTRTSKSDTHHTHVEDTSSSSQV